MNHFNKTIKTPFLSLVAVIALFLTSSLAFAQEGTRVYLQPVDSAAGILTVDVVAENVDNLYGAEFRLGYDPAVVSVQDNKPEQEGVQIEAGGLLPVDQSFVVVNQVDEVAGKLTFALTLLNPAPPVNGSGVLARVTFDVLQNTSSTIEVEHAKLVSFDLQTIPIETASLTIGSQSQGVDTIVSTTAGTPQTTADSREFPWWIVALVVMIVGLVSLGAFVMMGGLNQPPEAASAQAQVTGPQTPNQRSQHPTSTRPSAFNTDGLSKGRVFQGSPGTSEKYK